MYLIKSARTLGCSVLPDCSCEMRPGHIFTIALAIAVLQTSAAYDAASCCKKPGIQLTVDCTTTPGVIQWQWQAKVQSMFGFCITYDCELPTDGDYCSERKFTQVCFNEYDKSQSQSKRIEELEGISDGDSCWFWIKDVGAFDFNDDSCSEPIHCNLSSTTLGSSTEASSTVVSLAQASSLKVYPTSLTSLSLISSVVPISSVVSNEIATSAAPMNSPLSISLSSISVTPSTSISIVSIPVYVETSSAYLTASSVTNSVGVITESTNMATETIVLIATPVLSKTPQTITTQHRISFFVTFSCVIVFITLLLTVALFIYWNKRKEKDFETSMKIRIENECCCQDIDDIAKESDSEIEIVIDHGTEDDVISIMEDDLYMYNEILYPWHTKHIDAMQETPLVLSQLSILTDSEFEGGSVTSLQLSNDYYRTNSGSAGRCSQSNATTSQHSHTSNTPTNSNDDT